MIIKKLFSLSVLASCSLILCNCSSTPESIKKKSALPKSHSSYPKYELHKTYNDIDVDALIRELQMNSPFNKVGFVEKSFNSCRIRSNRSPRPKCQRLFLGKVNYKVMFRRSTGTVQTVNLRPLNNSRLRWKKGKQKGYTRTNSQGFGSIYYITPTPSR
ncbi:MAG: hypothetical protein HRT44_06960, partial [Bdellovibrionales bacterium]|nr:hypothetical protein [Bdellovibrionales bacterium]NQZ18977.1 hypothetical protein [Bdellovibrionales bacterium]